MGYRAGRGVSAVIRIGLTDDEPLLTAGLAMLLGAQGDMEVVWRAADGHQALRRAESDPVDLVSCVARGRIIILTTFDTDGYVLGAIEAGAAGFLLKSTAPERLVEAVRTVHAGDSVISPGPTRRLLGAVRRGAPAPSDPTARTAAAPGAAGGAGELAGLTGREREILRLVAIGLTNREICDRLWVSMPTVKTHVSHLLAKTGSRDRVQLVLLALRSGVVRLDEVLAQ